MADQKTHQDIDQLEFVMASDAEKKLYEVPHDKVPHGINGATYIIKDGVTFLKTPLDHVARFTEDGVRINPGGPSLKNTPVS